MTESNHEQPNLDDVIDPTESAPRDRQEHAKAPAHPNDEELEHRTEHERVQAGLADYEPGEVPAADA
jgi:hypothetical protein